MAVPGSLAAGLADTQKREKAPASGQPDENPRTSWTPDITDYATVEANCQGVPVYAFGYTYVYGVGPDFQPAAVLQEGNAAAAIKIQPKKSWEIKGNLFGSTPAREPRTAANDDQPLLGVHLIDGDPLSCWASRGRRPNEEIAWVRIDLPAEAVISRVVLVGHPQGMGRSDPKQGIFKVGQSFPKKLTIRVSLDARRWDTVYQTDAYVPTDIGDRNEISFDRRQAKQIWILGDDLPSCHYFGHCFSVAGIEVLDEKGEDVALISRGAGVQVSSTHTGFGMDRFTQDMLWPTQYDLGFKWTRVGYAMGLFLWSYVEREKGKLQVDERAEAALTEAVRNGLQVVLCLDQGNWLYAPEPKKSDRTRDLMENYSNHPAAPGIINWQSMLMDYRPQFEGYLNFVRFMVRRFKDQVKVFEVWNEWYPWTYEGGKTYARLLRAAIKVIREEHPKAEIMPSSSPWSCCGDPPRGLLPDGFGFFKALGEEGLLAEVDWIGIHPLGDAEPYDPNLVSFPTDFLLMQRIVEGFGFKGRYMASEWLYYSSYDPKGHSEMQKAIYAARLGIVFAHLSIVNLWNETFQTMMGDLSLFRNTFSNEVINPTQPEPVYYALRTLSTVLEDTKGSDLRATFHDAQREVKQCGFVRGDKEKLLAFWLPGVAEKRGNASILSSDVEIQGVNGYGASIIDVLNGTEKPLKLERTTDGILIRRILVQDWPLIIRLPG